MSCRRRAYYVLTGIMAIARKELGMRITKRAVDSQKPTNKTYYIWDDQQSGFGVKILSSGRKTYLVQYRIGGRGGKTRRVTLGVHGSITSEQARGEAKKVLGQAAIGNDPLAERDALREAQTVAEILKIFMSDHVDAKLAKNSRDSYAAIIRLHLPEKFKSMLIGNVTRQDVARIHHGMRSGVAMANKTLAVLSKFFNWCEKFGYRNDHTNPCKHIEKYKEIPRTRFLSPQEQTRLWSVLDRVEKERLATLYSVNALRVIILTGARLREILHLKWAEIDLDRGVLNLSKSKTGAKTIYLNETAVVILRKMPKQFDNPYVFCGLRTGQPIQEIQKAWQRIRKLADIEDVRIHDLRHTFASVAVMNGMSLPMIGALLGHSQPRTTARYAHLAADPLREAAELVGQKLLQRD